MKRAYSLFTVKSIDEDQRIIEGIATTPTTDRMGDVVDSEGAQFKLPLPLLWMHNSREPVGHVTAAKVSKDGIAITAKLASIAEPGKLKDRLDEAWQSLKIGLVRGLSIGFSPIESAQIKDSWAEHFLKWDWLELSCVTIPANAEANIISVKSADQALLAASGHAQRHVVQLDKSIPGVSGKSLPKGKDMEKKTIAEQISAFEAKRAASAERMNAIMAKSAEDGSTLDETQTQEYDGLATEVKSIDDHLVRLKAHEVAMVKAATPVTKAVGTDPGAASDARGGSIISVKSNLPAGIAFVRMTKALIAAHGNPMLAKMYAEGNKQWGDETPEVNAYFKTAVAGGTTTASGWASEWVYAQNLINEFIGLLRPQTVIGKLTMLTKVPFNIRVSGMDSGSSASWVGQGKAIPVSKGNSIEVTLGMAKVAGLVVLTEELVRSSEPSAEAKMRDDMIGAIVEFCDRRFLDPNYAAVTNVSPASITNGLTATVPSGTNLAALRADIQTLFRAFIAINDNPLTATWIMDPTMALTFSMMQNALGQNEFPDIGMEGGRFAGLPAVVSNCANITGSPDSGHMLILAKQKDIMVADDGQIAIDASREASIEMTDTPTGDASAGTAGITSLVSMFQSNSVALRAIRPINWKKSRSSAVVYIKECAYVA